MVKRGFSAYVLTLGLAFSVLTAAAASQRAARPDTGRVPSSDGVLLHYEVHGTGGEPAVVLHGGPGLSLRYLWPDLEPLVQGRRLIFYDQRGGGRSTIPNDALITAAKHVEDLEEVRKFFGLERMTLVGHSWGAVLATLYADRYPNRVGRMLLIDPGPPRQEPYEKQFEEAVVKAWGPETLKQIEKLGADMERAQDPTTACRMFYDLYTQAYVADPETRKRSKGTMCLDPPGAIRAAQRVGTITMRSLGERYDWRPKLRKLTVPSLVIHGSEDPIPLESAREWAMVLPNARLLIIPNSGHFPFFEQPEAFFSAADRFLRGEWPAGASR